MRRPELIARYKNFIRQYGLAPEECLLSAGGALMMLQVRTDTKDLDLDVRQSVYEKFKEMGYPVRKICSSLSEELIEFNEVIDIHDLDASIRALGSDVVGTVTHGVGHYTAEEVLMQKLALGRSKDQTDVLALKAYLQGTRPQPSVSGNLFYNDWSPVS